ncbi:hypothetical protein PYCC9005_000560 [Savitreella phatthalungensis]
MSSFALNPADYLSDKPSPARPIEVLVIGAGGIGSLYATLLERGGNSADAGLVRISLVARSNHDAISRRGGIEVSSKKYGELFLKHARLFRTVQEAVVGQLKYDFVVCTTKALNEPGKPSTAELLKPALESSPGACIVAIQNGLGIEEPLHEQFPHHPLIGCTAYTGVWQEGEARVCHAALDRMEVGVFPEVSLEMCPNSASKESYAVEFPEPVLSGPAALRRASANTDSNYVKSQLAALTLFVSLLRRGGCQVLTLGSIVAGRWKKLVWNGSFNPVCAILDMDTEKICADAAASRLVERCMREVCAVARADGITFDDDTLVAKNFKDTQDYMGAYKPSMQLDRLAKRKMELSVILGEPIRRAKEYGVAVGSLESCRDILTVLEEQTGV